MGWTVTIVPLLVLASLAGCVADDGGYVSLPTTEWKARLGQTPEAFLLDVRTSEECRAGHIPNATLIPFDEVRERADGLPGDKNTPIFVYCRTGNRSGQASETLVEMGYMNVTSMRPGGYPDWAEAGYPSETGA